jgi:uncharacterized protein YaiI (UPF0178 family)
MKIWIDADACPGAVKEILYRASDRRGIAITLVANQFMRIHRSPLVDLIVVESGPDIADDRIVELVTEGDLVITEDIPLAARIVEKKAYVITPHGQELTDSNIGERLSTRNFMQDLRGAGVETGGPAQFSQRDRQLFANQLDRLLTRILW